ncbi:MULTISPECIES: 3-hydroxyacyl-ACP dehydratase FabZ family protein [Streptomyces]|uniref:3-hydroxyacyl-ACP dehydratase FabZ family protein n=1 Tax=Streptomyces TaxID=1883 RepID=UPI00168BFB50|nr:MULTISPECIES: beta-hydroxyacyl-ACP dehydratase [unclassified Streptomyces]MBD3009698.1 beta-hydroxyacyl-ACP dehydratase [Streptomyces sp. 5-10]
MSPVCTPVAGRIEHGTGPDGTTRVSMTVGPEEPVFPGHYPGFPIFPGVCVIEFLHRGALAAAPEPDHTWVLSGIDSARFMNPVLPGDAVTADLTWRRDGASGRCSASVTGPRGTIARIALRFEDEGAR